MRAAIASIGACQGCGACLLTCPTAAIRPAGPTRPASRTAPGAVLSVREDLCTGCAECIEVCPVDAIDLVPRGSRYGGLQDRYDGVAS